MTGRSTRGRRAPVWASDGAVADRLPAELGPRGRVAAVLRRRGAGCPVAGIIGRAGGR